MRLKLSGAVGEIKQKGKVTSNFSREWEGAKPFFYYPSKCFALKALVGLIICAVFIIETNQKTHMVASYKSSVSATGYLRNTLGFQIVTFREC